MPQHLLLVHGGSIPPACAWYAEVLRTRGYHVTELPAADRALSVLDPESRPDAVLLHVPPSMEGFGFLLQVRADERYRDLPIAVFTARDFGPVSHKTARLLNAACVAGPLTAEELLALVQSMLTPSGAAAGPERIKSTGHEQCHRFHQH